MRTKQVASAIIRDGNKIFATQRGHGEFKGYWEFPGGKLEPGESPEQAAVREVSEELSVDIKLGELVSVIDYDYPDFHLKMHCYFAEVVSGVLTLKEHEDARWLTRETLNSVEWLPADTDVIEKLRQLI